MSSKLALIVPSLLALATSTQALSSEWVLLGTDKRGGKWLMKRMPVVQGEQQVNAWKRIEFTHPFPRFPDGRPIKTVHFLDETDCFQQLVSLKAVEIRDADDAVVLADSDGGSGVPSAPWSNLDLQKKASEMICARMHDQRSGETEQHQ